MIDITGEIHNLPCRILSMYDVGDEDIDSVIDRAQLSAGSQTSSRQMELPVLELLKVGAYSCYFHIYWCEQTYAHVKVAQYYFFYSKPFKIL